MSICATVKTICITDVVLCAQCLTLGLFHTCLSWIFYIFCSPVELQADSDMLRHARVAALVPNKNGYHGDDDSDSTSDDTSSHILMCGNSSSSQGGGQQSGSGQNSGNQNSASHQGSAGGGQSSSSGTTGQGSSSGGDGNDEEDKEKIKLAKDSSRQNEVCV